MKRTFITLLLITSLPVKADSSFLCVSEYTTGFSYNKDVKKWQPGQLDKSAKYILMKENDVWELYNQGTGSMTGSVCNEEFNMNGFISCSGTAQFKMNKDSLRFLYIHSFGYVIPGKAVNTEIDGKSNPYMSIGTCSIL